VARPLPGPAVGTVSYLTLIALLSLGVAAAARNSAAQLRRGHRPRARPAVPVPDHRGPHLQPDPRPAPGPDRPLTAGLDAQATTGINSLPLTPWQGLGVVARWTAGALLFGALALRFRDA
jgi:ABC-2 type transport system permease protein